jgi:Domain of unknown function (DUF6285)
MNDISDAADLLDTARDALTHELLPLLPRERRYVGLMIGNVMGIAARELRAGALAMAGETERAAQLLGDSGLAGGDARAAADALPALRRALSTAIRAGRFDQAPASAALMAHLTRTAADWVAISNPKAVRTS